MCRVFGRKQYYACPLNLCIRCHALYWQRYGHPCPSAEAEAEAEAEASTPDASAPASSSSERAAASASPAAIASPSVSVATTTRRITSPPAQRAGGRTGQPQRVNGERDDDLIYRDKVITPEKFVQLFKL